MSRTERHFDSELTIFSQLNNFGVTRLFAFSGIRCRCVFTAGGIDILRLGAIRCLRATDIRRVVSDRKRICMSSTFVDV